MATVFYLRDLSIGIDAYRLSTLERGGSATSIGVATTSGGSWISLGFCATKPLEGFTLAGSVSFNLMGLESQAQANASLGMRIYKYTNGVLGSSLGQASSGTELTTSEMVRTASVTPTSTVFSAGSILVVEIGAINVGTMGSRTVEFFYNGPTAAASGDSYFTITENVTYNRRNRITG